MTTEFVQVPETMTVDEALASVRRIARAGRREAMHTIYVTDAQGVLRGVMSLRELLAAPKGARIADIAWEEVVSVPGDRRPRGSRADDVGVRPRRRAGGR